MRGQCVKIHEDMYKWQEEDRDEGRQRLMEMEQSG